MYCLIQINHAQIYWLFSEKCINLPLKKSLNISIIQQSSHFNLYTTYFYGSL